MYIQLKISGVQNGVNEEIGIWGSTSTFLE